MPRQQAQRPVPDARQQTSISQLTGPGELKRLLQLTAASPEAPSWPADAWIGLLVPDAEEQTHRVLFGMSGDDGCLTGIAAVSLFGEVVELELLLVRPRDRRQGIGRALSLHWLRWAEQAGATQALLEVRESNDAAQAVYFALGFFVEGRRPRYYHGPEEDALLMRKQLRPSVGAMEPRNEHVPKV